MPDVTQKPISSTQGHVLISAELTHYPVTEYRGRSPDFLRPQHVEMRPGGTAAKRGSSRTHLGWRSAPEYFLALPFASKCFATFLSGPYFFLACRDIKLTQILQVLLARLVRFVGSIFCGTHIGHSAALTSTALYKSPHWAPKAAEVPSTGPLTGSTFSITTSTDGTSTFSPPLRHLHLHWQCHHYCHHHQCHHPLPNSQYQCQCRYLLYHQYRLSS